MLVQFANRHAWCWWRPMWRRAGWISRSREAVINADVTQEPEQHIHRTAAPAAGESGAEPGQREGDAARTRIEDEQGRDGGADVATLTPAGSELGAADGDAADPGSARRRFALATCWAHHRRRGISGDKVGKITIAEFSTHVAVQRDVAKAALAPPVLDQNQGQRRGAAAVTIDDRLAEVQSSSQAAMAT